MGSMMAPQAGGARRGASNAADEAGVLGALRGVNYSSVQSNLFRILPNANGEEYEFLIEEAAAAKAKGSGNPMITLKLKCIWPQEYAGVIVYDQCVLTDTALWKSKSLFEACGLLDANGLFAGEKLADLQEYAVRASIQHDTYQGTTRNKIAGGYMEAYEHPDLRPTLDATGQAGAAQQPAPLQAGVAQPDWQQPGLMPNVGS